jgi:hypothetical protein
MTKTETTNETYTGDFLHIHCGGTCNWDVKNQLLNFAFREVFGGHEVVLLMGNYSLQCHVHMIMADTMCYGRLSNAKGDCIPCPYNATGSLEFINYQELIHFPHWMKTPRRPGAVLLVFADEFEFDALSNRLEFGNMGEFSKIVIFSFSESDKVDDQRFKTVPLVPLKDKFRLGNIYD